MHPRRPRARTGTEQSVAISGNQRPRARTGTEPSVAISGHQRPRARTGTEQCSRSADVRRIQPLVARSVPVGKGRRGEHLHAGLRRRSWHGRCLMRETITRHQASSGVIRRHQPTSAVIRGHKRPSRGHQCTPYSGRALPSSRHTRERRARGTRRSRARGLPARARDLEIRPTAMRAQRPAREPPRRNAPSRARAARTAACRSTTRAGLSTWAARW
jgi:hypothetical protein